MPCLRMDMSGLSEMGRFRITHDAGNRSLYYGYSSKKLFDNYFWKTGTSGEADPPDDIDARIFSTIYI